MFRAMFVAPLLLILAMGCHRVTRQPMKDTVGMADPSVASQLVSGFYNLEAKSWRWTAQQFCVTFSGSSKVESKTLTLHLFIPDTQIQKLGQITLNADLNGNILGPETYYASGTYVYKRVVSGTALESNLIPVVFFLDKVSPPEAKETRELGIIVSNVELQAN